MRGRATRARGAAWLASAAALAASGCSTSAPGEVLLAIDTDMAVPKDIDGLEIEIAAGGTSQRVEIADLGDASGRWLPATFGVVIEDEPDQPITLRVLGVREGEAVVERSATLRVPGERAVTLRAPLDFLCRGPVDCGGGQVCVAGACEDAAVDGASLPDYAPPAVFGDGACFQVPRCFRGAEWAEGLDTSDCTLDAPGDVQIALATEGEGLCGVNGCFVALEAGSARGWARRPDGKIQLPKAACKDPGVIGVLTAPIEGACPLKTPAVPLCLPELDDAPVAVAAWQDHATGLAVGSDSVLWLSHEEVKRVAAEGGAPIELAAQQEVPRRIATCNQRVFWTNQGAGAGDGSIGMIGADGSPVALWTGRDAPEGITCNAARIFWTERGGVYSSIQDGTLAPVQIAAVDSPCQIAAASDYVCWTGPVQQSVSCVRIRPDGSADGAPLVVGSSESPYAIALDVDANGALVAVIWTDLGVKQGDTVEQDTGRILRRFRSAFLDPSLPEELATKQSYPTGVAVDEGSMYWTCRNGTVLQRPKAGDGAPIALAAGQRTPGAIDVNDQAIYWVNEGEPAKRDGAVLRLAKPAPSAN